MALITIASAKGSPGVTTAALALGGLWPRPVIVAECDPAGGDIALRMPAADGQVLDLQTGLLSLVAAGRKSLQPDLVRQHTQTIVGGLEILAGVNLPEQNAALTHKWALFGPLFAAVEDFDVIADLGRIGAMTPQNNLLGSAQAIAMVVDTTPSNVVHLRERLAYIHSHHGGPLGVPVHVLVHASPKRGQAVREIRYALERSENKPAGVHHVAHDERGANVFQGQIKGDPARTPFVRSLVPVAAELAQATQSYFRTSTAAEVRVS